jgi:hypothetical protein
LRVPHRRRADLLNAIPIVIANPAKPGEAIHPPAQCLPVDCFAFRSAMEMLADAAAFAPRTPCRSIRMPFPAHSHSRTIFKFN